MRAIIGIGILQLAVTGFLLFKVVSLETNIDQIKSKLSANTRQPVAVPVDIVALDPKEYEQNSKLSIDDIRGVVRAELDGALSRNQDSRLTVEERESDPVLISEFESRIDYYLSDGEFSRLDLQDMENKLIKLAPADRRKMMNKLTKAMSKANIQLIE